MSVNGSSKILFNKLPVAIEFLINGGFVLLYSFLKSGKNIFHLSPDSLKLVLDTCVWLIPLVILVQFVGKLLSTKSIEELLRRHVFTLIILVPMFISFGDIEFVYWLAAVHLFSTAISSFEQESSHTENEKFIIPSELRTGLFSGFKLSPAQIVLVTWTVTIVFGALLLVLPVSSAPGKSIGIIDALFVSTSAISTTGLSTISLHDDLSFFGQIVVMVLIQIGGIGFMTMSSAFLMVTGKSFAIKEQVILQDILDATAISELYEMVLDIVRYTFAIEFIGMIVLAYGFYSEGFEIGDALWLGAFHSISAFCTAGFGLFNTNMEAFTTNTVLSLGCTILAILGGIGFLVMKEVIMVLQRKLRWSMISMHSKVILVTSFWMYAIGTMIIFVGEFNHSLESYNLFDEFHVALFQFAATMSTSGFNSVPMNSLHSYTLYLMLVTMFIGCSPGSTGGGIKITTFAVLLQSVKTTLYGKKEVEFFNRSIEPSLVVRATALTIISLVVVTISIFIIMAVEPSFSFLQLSFEVLSAFGTVGLSMGITSTLSALGKTIITAVMYVGRIGPLTLVLALAEQSNKHPDVGYPRGKIIIG